MALKNLEHDGNEDFLEDDFPNRNRHSNIKLAEEKDIEDKKDQSLIEQQEAWLNMENPFLWEGEI